MTTKPETTKKPGTGLMNAGLLIAIIGVFLVIAVFSSGGAPTLIVWALPFIGAILAAVGFGKRLLAALESR